MGCCRASWSPTSSTLAILENHHEEEEGEEEEEELDLVSNANQAPTTATGMNLAMALAAERNSRDENVKTLMRLIEETDGVDWRKKRRKDKNNNNNNNINKGLDDTNSNWVCCVCMERSKGAAFIPCGHTFCRVCSRELWLNRGSCPICNRSILEILDIF
ncbi:putative e3 ubiquitin-protein ligase lul4 [Quercus suber]|uniref:E3 ubiquitin-protein ligase lul4 n=1 Tax=Quercus suber TaxID=58331 RepID=A0AAW0MCC1_QUESU